MLKRLLEPLILAETQRRAESLAADVRQPFARELARSRQQAEAAETLFDGGHPAEAVALARSALESMVAALRVLDSGEGPADWERAAKAYAVPETTIDALRAAHAVEPRTLLDGEVSAEDAAQLHRSLGAQSALHRALGALAWAPAQVTRLRRTRFAMLGAGALLLVGGAVLAFRSSRGTFANASAVFEDPTSRFVAAHAVDGDPETEWLLPNHSTGWIDVTFNPPRRVEELTLVNARNPPYLDRATREYRLEVVAGGSVQQTIEGSFGDAHADSSPQSHPVGLDNVERVRVHVLSFHEWGGGVAELRVQ